jgi:hypothetical protein
MFLLIGRNRVLVFITFFWYRGIFKLGISFIQTPFQIGFIGEAKSPPYVIGQPNLVVSQGYKVAFLGI